MGFNDDRFNMSDDEFFDDFFPDDEEDEDEDDVESDYPNNPISNFMKQFGGIPSSGFMAAGAIGPDGKFRPLTDKEKEALKNSLRAQKPFMPMMLSGSMGAYFTLFNGEWLVRCLNTEDNDMNFVKTTGTMHFQVLPNVRWKGPRKADIYEVYEYILKSHYFKILISYYFEIPSYWCNEGISAKIIYNQTDPKHPNIYIDVGIRLYPLPDYCSGDLADTYRDSYSDIVYVGDKQRIPCSKNVTFFRSYHVPQVIIQWDFAINPNGYVDFNNISAQALYHHLLTKDIEKVLNAFYPSAIGYNDILKESLFHSLLNAQYIINSDEFTMSITGYFSPAYLTYDKSLFRVDFMDRDNFLLHVDNTNPLLKRPLSEEKSASALQEANMFTFLNNAFSTPDTQNIILSISTIGNINNYQSSDWMLYKISKVLISTNMIIRDEEMQGNRQLFDQIEEEYPQYYIFPNIPSTTFDGLNLIIPNLTYNINRDTILNLYAIMVFDLTKVNAAHVVENINKFIDKFKDTLNPRIIHLLETGRMHYALAYNDQRFLKLALIDTAVRDNSNKPTESSSEKKPPNKRKGLGFFGI